MPAGESELRLPMAFKRLGYAVGGFGKWGLGPVGTSGGAKVPNAKAGFACRAWFAGWGGSLPVK